MPAEPVIPALTEDILDRLINAHDGDIALLYLYKVRNPAATKDDAARDLCRTMNEISSADEKLGRMLGIPCTPAAFAASDSSVQPLPAAKVESSSVSAARKVYPPPEEFPSYTLEEITRRGSTDSDFQSLIGEAKRITGGFLSESFTRALFGIYDYLALPAEVIMMLLNYCGEIAAARPNRPKLSSRDLEQEAYRWYNNGVVTLEAAEEYIENKRKLHTIHSRLKAVLNISGRNFTQTELKYIDEWLSMGFGEDAIALAYDRTVTNTGSLKWNYMNKIMNSWNEKKLYTQEQILAADGHRRTADPSGSSSFSDDELVSLLSKLQEV